MVAGHALAKSLGRLDLPVSNCVCFRGMEVEVQLLFGASVL